MRKNPSNILAPNTQYHDMKFFHLFATIKVDRVWRLLYNLTLFDQRAEVI